MKLSPGGLGRLWRTVRWLRPEQVVGRVAMRVRRPRIDSSPAGPLRVATGPWATPPARAASLVGPVRWRLLAEEHDLEQVGWDDPGIALLWRYNQHYFDDLNAMDAGARTAWHRALIERWCTECPPGQGTAWAPYPTSLRIVNWIKWQMGGNALGRQPWHNLAMQARWLKQCLEWHLLGNHLFANGKALVFAGLAFDSPESERWLGTGLRILERELPEQILVDGGQFERSPMYHALALEDVLDLLNALRALAPEGSVAKSVEPSLRRNATAMLAWLRCMRYPDGSLGRFNDCSEGIAPPTDAIEAYAAALGVQAAQPPVEGVVALEPSGYRRVSRGGMVAILDLAPIGPDYLPGHAHADTLSFELCVAGRAMIVNRGTSIYGTGARRQLERGTAAHSTLQLGTVDSSEVWAGFRVGRRARPRAVVDDGWRIAAAHDGYTHLPGRPVHHRQWQFSERDVFIEDRVEPRPRLAARARYHLAPGLRLQPAGAAWAVLDERDAPIARAEICNGRATVERWDHASSFGTLVPAETLVVVAGDDARIGVRWSW